MKRRRWSGKDKPVIVLEGLKDGAIFAELCNRHQTIPNQYYPWYRKRG